MTIQLEFNDTQNFTGRARIKQKNELFSLQLIDRQGETVRIHVKFDRSTIERECKLKADEPKEFVLDVFVLGDIHRHVLPEYRSEDELELVNIPDGANLEFRLKVISRSDDASGKILAATSGRVRLHTGSGDEGSGEQNKGIFHPKPSTSIGDRIWQLGWDGHGDFEVFVNADYFHKFVDDALFAAHVFPEIVRNVATGILLRYDNVKDIDEDSLLAKWVTFIQQRLGIPLEGEEAAYLKDADNLDRLEIVDQIVGAFASQKWRDGKTLLEEIL
ncbi:hypothetical protein JQT66_12300 [Sulfitobacter mediterraneus]|uniref:hypothetical protein n=1 Tax=Sulfitobacter mediterraneus TaxID=83219 RepID=UPI0019344E53|nr:hypothetical protein [Sulfitobacter mediterraneus]MBM1311017.1 hypothetical protein [Sulfitobacter mediterraneus]MBM1314900.1 hypothetical protein [Sulfitobacter mediterraneus]MBM1323260.1 hypothetical protein [Sulfitobacter mediterraneus]MBM1327172.1 hypothetical protein [Sulfitobacter mediterraneus]MBM1398519.1 hypothetical protein [Sulfitobacter mediterraneus]